MTERAFHLLLDTVERLLRRQASSHLVKVLKKTHPADLARLIQQLPESHAYTVFNLLPDVETAAGVLSEMEPVFRKEFLQNVTLERLVEILSAMPDDNRAELLGDMPEEFRQNILNLMPEEDKEEVNELLQYAEDTAGRIMTGEFVALPESMTARKAIQEVRQASAHEMVFYLYVTDEKGRLSGVLSLRQLVTAADETPLSEIMIRDVVKVHVADDQEEVARIVSRYNLLAVPVVDEEEILVGIVTVDDVVDVLREEATEDILKMAGVPGEDTGTFSLLRSVKTRLPWLFATWIGGVINVQLIGGFERFFREKLLVFAAMAAFIPIILGMGGNVGTQSLSLKVRGLATGHLDPKSLWKEMFREIQVGFILGITYGILLGIVGLFMTNSAIIGLIVGIAISANMTLAALVGTFLPLMAARFRIDPAVASGPFVATSMDILGLTIYFATASFFIFRYAN
jgi:magnesium transporter